MPSFLVLNGFTAFLALAIFGITISASIVSWYNLKEEFNLAPFSSTTATSDIVLLNRTEVSWTLQRKEIGVTVPFGKSQNSTYTRTGAQDYSSDQAIFGTMKLVQAFAITALLLSGILSIYFVLLFFAVVRLAHRLTHWYGDLKIVILVLSRTKRLTNIKWGNGSKTRGI